jgi:hypothetical protein
VLSFPIFVLGLACLYLKRALADSLAGLLSAPRSPFTVLPTPSKHDNKRQSSGPLVDRVITGVLETFSESRSQYLEAETWSDIGPDEEEEVVLS